MLRVVHQTNLANGFVQTSAFFGISGQATNFQVPLQAFDVPTSADRSLYLKLSTGNSAVNGNIATAGMLAETSTGALGCFLACLPFLQSKVKGVAAQVLFRYWIGFIQQGANPWNGNLNTATPNVPTVAFRFIAGTDTTWKCCVGNGGALTVVDSLVALATSVGQQLWIRYDGTNFTFFIDGIQVAQVAKTDANAPPESTQLRAVAYVDNQASGGVKVLNLSYLTYDISE